MRRRLAVVMIGTIGCFGLAGIQPGEARQRVVCTTCLATSVNSAVSGILPDFDGLLDPALVDLTIWSDSSYRLRSSEMEREIKGKAIPGLPG